MGSEYQARNTAEHIAAANRCRLPITPTAAHNVDTPMAVELFSGRELQQFRNTLSGSDGSRGGCTQPEGFVPRVEQAMGSFPVAKLATIERRNGNPVRIPSIDLTSSEAIEVEDTTNLATANADPTFGLAALRKRPYIAHQRCRAASPRMPRITSRNCRKCSATSWA